jgi:hypothetical protein
MRLTGLTDRTFGIELEVLFPRRGATRTRAALAAKLTEAGVDTRDESYNHQARTWWKITTDASITGGYDAGCEIVSPVLKGEDGLKQIEKVCAVLKRCGFRIDNSCGFHVHHGASDLDVKALRALARMVNRFEPVIDGLLPESRRKGHNTFVGAFHENELEAFERATVACCGMGSSGRDGGAYDCRLRRGNQRNAACVACGAGRYRNLNLRALHQHGTVEFRQHSGTIEAEKIVPWIMLTQGLVEKAKAGRGRQGQMKANGDALAGLLRHAGLTSCKPHGHVVAPEFAERAESAVKFFRARAATFGVIDTKTNSAKRSRDAARAARTLTAAVAAAVSAENTVVAAETAATGETA